MARVITREVSSVTGQGLNDAGINPFAVQLLVESFAAPTRVAKVEDIKPLTFVWRGVEISLKVYEGPLG